MEPMKARKSPMRRAKIEALQSQMTREEGDVAAHILDCIVRGSYFDPDEMTEKHPQALELAYLHLSDDKQETAR